MGGIKVRPDEVRRRGLDAISDLVRTAERALANARDEIASVKAIDAPFLPPRALEPPAEAQGRDLETLLHTLNEQRLAYNLDDRWDAGALWAIKMLRRLAVPPPPTEASGT